jgi:hypothetical protein
MSERARGCTRTDIVARGILGIIADLDTLILGEVASAQGERREGLGHRGSGGRGEVYGLCSDAE